MKKKTRKIEVPMVEITIELSERFYEEMQKAKANLEEKYDWKMDDGEYLERCIEDFMIMITTLEKQCQLLRSQGMVAHEEDNSHIYG